MMFGFYGTSGSFGIFLKPLEELFGSTRAAVAGGMSVFTALTGIVGIFAGRLIDKYDARIIIGAGAIIGGIGYLLMNQVSSLWQLHLFFGILAGSSMGTCFTPLIAIVSKWFTQKRVLAVGITTIGIALGQMVVPPLAALFMTDHGWRSSYVLLAIILVVTSMPAVIFLKRKPSQTAAMPAGYGNAGNIHAEIHIQTGWSVRDAIRTTPFWMVLIVGFATAAGFYVVLVHLVAYAIDLGTNPPDAALILTLVNAGLFPAQLLVWFLAKRLSSRIALIILLAIQALALYLLIGIVSFNVILVLGLIYGFGFGGANTVRLSMIAEIFGTRSAGAIVGVVSFAWSVGGIAGPLLAGYIFDVSQSYDAAFLMGGVLLTVGAAAGFFIKAPKVRLPAV